VKAMGHVIFIGRYDSAFAAVFELIRSTEPGVA
jgi:hypothetical protein